MDTDQNSRPFPGSDYLTDDERARGIAGDLTVIDLAVQRKQAAESMPPWRPANNGAGERPYFLYRGDSVPWIDRWYFNTAGDLVRYKNHKTAQRAADRLNRP